MAVQDDLSLTGINFALLRKKQLRKWRFYTSVSILMAFAAFPVRFTAPVYSDVSATHAPIPPAAAAGNATELLAMGIERNYAPTFRVPRQSVWLYVDGTYAHLSTIPYLQETRVARNSTAADGCFYEGWRVDGGPWEFAPFDEALLDDLTSILKLA